MATKQTALCLVSPSTNWSSAVIELTKAECEKRSLKETVN